MASWGPQIAHLSNRYFLTGKYERDSTASAGSLSGPNPFGNSKISGRNLAILDVLTGVAVELGLPTAKAALVWVTPPVAMVIPVSRSQGAGQDQEYVAAPSIAVSRLPTSSQVQAREPSGPTNVVRLSRGSG